MTGKRGDIGQKRLEENANAGMDDTTKVILYQGANVSQLALMFGMERRTVQGKLAEVEPCGFRRRDQPIYKVVDAAPYLVKFQGDVEEQLKKMNAEDLPADLHYRFWSALRERSKHRLEMGELWETTDVLQHFSKTFQTMRLELNLLTDRLSRETELSEQQREILQGEVDACLEKVRKSLIAKFGAPEPDEAGTGPSEEGWTDDLDDIRVDGEEPETSGGDEWSDEL